MPRKDNYKAKWMAALEAGQKTGAEVASVAEAYIESAVGTQFGVTEQLSALHQTLIEAGVAAKSTCDLMDECRDIGHLCFKEVQHGIDPRISEMPSKIIARRLRDVLRLAEERIGILTSICEDQYEALGRIGGQMNLMNIQNDKTQRAAFNTLYLGRAAKPNEIEDYIANPRAYHRNSEYHELPEDWTSILTAHDRARLDGNGNYSHDDVRTHSPSSISDTEKQIVHREPMKSKSRKKGRLAGDVEFN